MAVLRVVIGFDEQDGTGTSSGTKEAWVKKREEKKYGRKEGQK